MANISGILEKIRKAIYGQEVRGSLADGLEVVNNETIAATNLSKTTKERQDLLDSKFNEQIKNMTLQDPSSAEIVAMRTNINGITHQTAGKRVDELESHLEDIKNIKTKTLGDKKCVVSFIFDDGRQSVFDKGLSLFKSNGLTASIALITQTLENQVGLSMTPNNILDMYNGGWSFLNHGYASTKLTSDIALDVATREIETSKKIANKYGIKLDGYVPSYGVIDEKFIDIVKKNYKFAFCNYESGTIDYNKDIFNLNRYSIENKNIATVKAKIDEAKNNNKYLALYLHDIIDSGDYCNTVANLQLIIDYCKSNNIEIMNVTEAMDYYFNIKSYNEIIPTYKKQLDLINESLELQWSYSTSGGATTKVKYEYLLQPITKVYWESYSLHNHRYTYFKDVPVSTPNKNLYCSIEVPIIFNGNRMECDLRVEIMNSGVSNGVINSTTLIASEDNKKSFLKTNFVILANTTMDNIRIRIMPKTTLAGNVADVIIYTPILNMY